MGTYAYLRRSLTMHEHQIANLLYIVPVSYTHLDVYKRQRHGDTVDPCGGKARFLRAQGA